MGYRGPIVVRLADLSPHSSGCTHLTGRTPTHSPAVVYPQRGLSDPPAMSRYLTPIIDF
jgi:hypothetical protein